MKYIAIIFVALLTSTSGILMAQGDTEAITIELNDPSKIGTLNLGIISGGIHIEGHDQQNVVVEATSFDGPNKSSNKQREDGMRRISLNKGYDLTADVKNNEIELHTSAMNARIDFHIKVPRKFTLQLSTINQGDIKVENVDGTIEVSNINGDIDLVDISGNVNATTINGHLFVNFLKIDPDIPMAFTTLNGKVDVTFPSNFKGDIKVKSDFGEVYSDFDFEVKTPDQTQKSSEKGSYKIIKDSWTNGTINGGGAEFIMKNMHGNIYIRKAK